MPGPTSRSAQASRSDSQEDLLDHLPPLDLPGEVTRSATPPRPPAAHEETEAARDSNTSAATESSPSESELEVGTTAAPAPDSSPLAALGPPSSRFVAVDLKLAGGSAPTAVGLKWLAEKGYRTVLDLRETSEVPPNFVHEVNKHHLRYIALPVSKKTIDPECVDRFNYEMAAADSRPLFFFDKDGSTAGTLWYIRRLVVDRVDQQIAGREARELGLTDQPDWQAAADYLVAANLPSARAVIDATVNGRRPQGAKDPAAATSQPGQPAAPGSAGIDPESPLPKKPASPPANVPATTRSEAATVSVVQTKPGPPPVRQSKSAARAVPAAAAGPPVYSDPNAWGALCALVVTGLSLPLAFWTRTLVPVVVLKALASLPAPGLRPKSLPAK
jgi:protein tyrosine phosphatase (PTP) superfamily phosphohydrolase (DUF442 family)